MRGWTRLTTVRAEVRQWLADTWDPDFPREAWHRLVIESGWAAPTWPVEWFGRGLGIDARPIVNEEFARAGANGTGLDVLNLYANTIFAHGSKEQKDASSARSRTASTAVACSTASRAPAPISPRYRPAPTATVPTG